MSGCSLELQNRRREDENELLYFGQSAQGGGSLTSQVDEAAPDVGVSKQPANQRQQGGVAPQPQFHLTDVCRKQDVEGRQEVVVAVVIHKGTCLGMKGASGQLIGRCYPCLPQGLLTSGWMWTQPGEALSW